MVQPNLIKVDEPPETCFFLALPSIVIEKKTLVILFGNGNSEMRFGSQLFGSLQVDKLVHVDGPSSTKG